MYIDIICGIVIALGFYIGYTRGIIRSFFAIVSILVAILASLKLSVFVIEGLEHTFSWDPRILVVLGFVITFILVLIIVRWLGRLIEGLFKNLKINFLNKLAGGVLFSIILTIFYSGGLYFLDSINVLGEQTKISSLSYPTLKTLPEKSKNTVLKMKPAFDAFWNKTVEAMDKVKQEAEEAQEGN